MIVEAPLLVRTPLPNNYESLLGYVLRISEENGYQSPAEIAQLAGMSAKHVKSRYLPVRKLAPIVGLNAQELELAAKALPIDEKYPRANPDEIKALLEKLQAGVEEEHSQSEQEAVKELG